MLDDGTPRDQLRELPGRLVLGPDAVVVSTRIPAKVLEVLKAQAARGCVEVYNLHSRILVRWAARAARSR